MAKILLKLEERTFKLASFTLQNSDGSLYFSILREGLSRDAKNIEFKADSEGVSTNITDLECTRKKLKKVSYHTTGLVRYHELSLKPVVGYPLTRLTNPFFFFECSIPDISKLDPYEIEHSDDDIILDISNITINGRFNTVFLIAPWNFSPKNGELILARHNNFFSLGVLFRNNPYPIPDGLDNHFMYFSPQASIAEAIQIDQDSALIEFHQKINDTSSAILYRSNGEGVYKMIFSATKRIEPRVQITFERNDLRVVEVSKTLSQVRFKIVDSKNNVLRNEPKIINIELDSEIY